MLVGFSEPVAEHVLLAVLGGDVHEAAIVSQQLGECLRRVARKQTDVLDGFIAPQIAHGRGDVADRAEVGAGG